MLVIVWQFQVKPEHAEEFETVYGSNGAWADLFRKANGYIGTELLHHSKESHRYLTVDRWTSERDYEGFLSHWKMEYEALDLKCEGLTHNEIFLGKWETIPPDTR